MVVYGEYREEGDRLIMSVPCGRCGAIIGDLAVDEVKALLSGRYGKVLCFDCEERSCPRCQKELSTADGYTIEMDGVCWFCANEGNVGVGDHYPGWIVDWTVNEDKWQELKGEQRL